MGHNVNDLIASWGPPQQILDAGDGNKIYVWGQVRSFTSPGTATTTTRGSATAYGNTATGTATSTTTYNPPRTSSYSATRSFWIDKNGKVYRWAWRGL